ncbi:hypothetical protein V7S43_010418 [Phytophthora oleae]|uniref:Apiosidase-like catalytic domain-containing protein n=1 Tax=Phytophthora oleae TaxID=2107226 RepID=A0ABD3FI56_9STRA
MKRESIHTVALDVIIKASFGVIPPASCRKPPSHSPICFRKDEIPSCSRVSLAGLATVLAEPSWHDLVITAPQYGRYLYRTTSEEPFFWKADTAWELMHRLNKTSIDFYLKTRAEQGYNVVLTVVLSAYNGTTRPNFYGDLPYNNSDTMQQNEAFFQLVDWTVDRAASYGILIALVPAWGTGSAERGMAPRSRSSMNLRPTSGETTLENGTHGIPKLLGGDTNCFWYENGCERCEKAKGYEPVILFHPTAGEIVRPVMTPMAYGHLMFPKEEHRVSIDAVQSGHATPDAWEGLRPTRRGILPRTTS